MKELNMNDENEHINIDIERLFPEAARRVRVLEELKRSWPSVVRNAAARSMPSVLGVNAITVLVDSEHTANMIRKMKGNIMRALSSRYGCMTDKDFTLTVKITR